MRACCWPAVGVSYTPRKPVAALAGPTELLAHTLIPAWGRSCCNGSVGDQGGRAARSHRAMAVGPLRRLRAAAECESGGGCFGPDREARPAAPRGYRKPAAGFPRVQWYCTETPKPIQSTEGPRGSSARPQAGEKSTGVSAVGSGAAAAAAAAAGCAIPHMLAAQVAVLVRESGAPGSAGAPRDHVDLLRAVGQLYHICVDF